jgi:hypothetical protein
MVSTTKIHIHIHNYEVSGLNLGKNVHSKNIDIFVRFAHLLFILGTFEWKYIVYWYTWGWIHFWVKYFKSVTHCACLFCHSSNQLQPVFFYFFFFFFWVILFLLVLITLFILFFFHKFLLVYYCLLVWGLTKVGNVSVNYSRLNCIFGPLTI